MASRPYFYESKELLTKLVKESLVLRKKSFENLLNDL